MPWDRQGGILSPIELAPIPARGNGWCRMIFDLVAEWLETEQTGRPCALVTVASTTGSVPREAGTKMLVQTDGSIRGTIGGGKLESLVIEAALQALGNGRPVLRTYPLREGQEDSFGAICGGEVTVLIEPSGRTGRLVLVGAGHCARAIARLAAGCGFQITVVDDRSELTDPTVFPEAHFLVNDVPMETFLTSRSWNERDVIVLVNRNHLLDREALRVLLPHASSVAYLGMIGSRRKVRRVFEELKEAGTPVQPAHRVFAPIGLDIGADSPEEIAISVMAEILKVLRKKSGQSLNSATE